MPRPLGYIRVTVRYSKEGDQWTALCRELGTATHADTLEEVQKEIEELIALHLSALDDAGERAAFFRKHGITFHRAMPRQPVRNVTVRPGEFVSCVTEPVLATT